VSPKLGQFVNIAMMSCSRKLYLRTQIQRVPKNAYNLSTFSPYTMEGFEPGLSVPQADAMTTAQRRQGNCKISPKLWAYLVLVYNTYRQRLIDCLITTKLWTYILSDYLQHLETNA
jgi:hypothetical protein